MHRGERDVTERADYRNQPGHSVGLSHHPRVGEEEAVAFRAPPRRQELVAFLRQDIVLGEREDDNEDERDNDQRDDHGESRIEHDIRCPTDLVLLKSS